MHFCGHRSEVSECGRAVLIIEWSKILSTSVHNEDFALAYVRTIDTLMDVPLRPGVLRALAIRRVSFAEGELDAGRYFWQQLRYYLRD